eukprot:GFUD01000403.1.p1 GENE.GFUD01000403.1~~GFUD01000403.1.p1  ORF type:complete len:806 (+),score=225.30 GFUD01000403.1:35-2419(+)
MYKKIVAKLAKSDAIVLSIRAVDGNDFSINVKPGDTIKAIKQQLWNEAGNNTKMNIGLDMVDFMEEFVKSSDISYKDFSSHSDDEQIRLLAKSGKLYAAFWNFYILVYDGHILEDEATAIGIGLTSGDPMCFFPRVLSTKNENIFLQLFMGIKRTTPEIKIGINDLLSSPHGLPIISKLKVFHSHDSPVDAEQCEYEMRLLRTILLPALIKILTGDASARPVCLPDLTQLYTRITEYEHSVEFLQDLHDIISQYKAGIVLHLSLSVPGERMVNRFEAEKREAIHQSLLQVTDKFETGISNVEGTESLWCPIYVGPARSFTNYNYTLAQPTLQLCGLNTGTTIGDLIESYQHHTRNPDQHLQFLIYDQSKHEPHMLVKDIIHAKLQKHFFYFHIEIDDDGRDINELVNFIGGACASPSKIKRRRKKTKPTAPKTLALQRPEIVETDNLAETPEEEAPIEVQSNQKERNEKPEDNDIDQGWRQCIDNRSFRENAVFTVSREYDFDITEEEDGSARGMTFEKAEYLDRLSGIIASKAQAEWENKKVGFEKLQREHEQIENEIRAKEDLLGDHKIKVHEMIELKAKEMEKFVGLISSVKEEKQEGYKQIDELEKQISKLESKVLDIEDQKKELDSKSEQSSDQIEKIDKKRRKLEKHIEGEMEGMKTEGEKIQDNIEELGKELSENCEKAEKLATLEVQNTVTETKPKENTSRVSEFLAQSIKEKEADLECPVCFETADIPIFMCSEMHLICCRCRPKIRECPECRLPYTGAAKRHRFAEKTAGELGKLKKELENLLA